MTILKISAVFIDPVLTVNVLIFIEKNCFFCGQVSVEVVIANFKKSAETVKRVMVDAIALLKTRTWTDLVASNRVSLFWLHFSVVNVFIICVHGMPEMCVPV